MKEWNFTFAWKERRRERDSKLSFEFDESGYVRCLHPDSKSHQQNDTATSHTQQQQHTSGILAKVKESLMIKRGDNDKDDDDKNTYIVGTWKLAPSGVVWKMAWDGTTYSFYADLQVSPFGDYPKMFRGLVIRDRSTGSVLPKRFFRPIVATFSGMGVGKDTADFSYKDRGPPKQ